MTPARRHLYGAIPWALCALVTLCIPPFGIPPAWFGWVSIGLALHELFMALECWSQEFLRWLEQVRWHLEYALELEQRLLASGVNYQHRR